MPTSFLSADAGFPRLTSDIPMEERMNRVQNYLYMLLEQLKYSLYNLGRDNFAEQELQDIEDGITGPIMSTVTDMRGNISTLQQTAESIAASVTNLGGDVASLELTATSLTTRLNNVGGSGSTIEQTAEALNFAVFDPAGSVSLVSQKADRIDWIVASTSTASSISLTPEMAQVVADQIRLYGTVTFNDLINYNGTTIINGDNIELQADTNGDSVSYLTYTSAGGNTFAEIHTMDNQSLSTLTADRYAFVIETPRVVDGDFCAMKLISGDSMSLESGWLLYMQAQSQVVINNGLLATRIQANNVSYVSGDQNYPNDCYIFAADGIWYNGNRILST